MPWCKYQFHVKRENKIIISGNVGKFFNNIYANRNFKCKSTIGLLKTVDGWLSVDPIRKTELLQSFFSSAYRLRKILAAFRHSAPVPPTTLK